MRLVNLRSGGSWGRRAFAVTSLVAAMSMTFAGVAYADNIQDSIDGAGIVALVAGSPTGGTAGVRVIGNGDGGAPSDPGCNWDPDEDPLVLDIATPAGVTASPNPLSITECGAFNTVTFTASASAVSGTATVSIRSTPAGGGTYANQVSIPITVTQPTPTNTKPSVAVTGVTNGASYEIGSVPTAGCSVTDAEDGPSSHAATLSGTLSHGMGTQTATCNHTDTGGLAADTKTATYTVEDTTDPVITLFSRSHPAGSWTNQDVSLVWTCSDGAGSGVDAAASTLSAIVSGEGEDQTSTGTCVDNAGNSATNTQINIDIDKTAPTITLSTRSHPAGTWTNQDVDLEWTCTDNTGGSGVDTAASTLSATVSAEGQNQTTGICVDNAGNSSADEQTNIDIDKTDPTITLSTRSHPAGTWTNQDVDLEWTCTDNTGGSGVDTAASTLSATVSAEGENQTSTGTCVDNAGNSSADEQTNIDIDKTDPTITLSTRSHPAGTWTNQDVDLEWTCTDNTGGSGVDTAASTLSPNRQHRRREPGIDRHLRRQRRQQRIRHGDQHRHRQDRPDDHPVHPQPPRRHLDQPGRRPGVDLHRQHRRLRRRHRRLNPHPNRQHRRREPGIDRHLRRQRRQRRAPTRRPTSTSTRPPRRSPCPPAATPPAPGPTRT